MSLTASAYPLLQFELDKFLLELQQQNKLIEAGVSVEGEAAAYAPVWEWGSARISKPGPKTVWGTNPNGERVVLSSQAPHGYIRVNSPLYLAALEKEMQKVSFASSSTDEIRKRLETAATNAAKQILSIIQEHVPVDTGQLHDSLKLVKPGDLVLEQEDDNALVITGEE